MESPNVPKTLAIARKLGWQFDIMSTSFFLSRRALKPAAHSGMPRWQDHLFIALSRTANDATDYFQNSDRPGGRGGNAGHDLDRLGVSNWLAALDFHRARGDVGGWKGEPSVTLLLDSRVASRWEEFEWRIRVIAFTIWRRKTSRRGWPRDAIFWSTSASRMRLPWRPIRTPSSFRCRVSIRRISPIPQGKQVVFACRSGKRSVTASLAAQAGGLRLRQASRGRNAGLEGRGIADQDRRLIAPMTSMNKVFADLPVTIFEAMSQLARDNNAINLGQGFPDDPGPEDIRRAAADAVMDGYNQYPSMMGIPELRQAIAAHYGRWHGLVLDPMTEVMVTSGGTEALTSAILAVVEPGDEVVVFQPVYDSYLPIIRQAGGIPRLVRLEPPHWRLTEEALRSVFNHKTKAVLFNNPLNPAAVVYPREDLELLARFCQEFDTVAICDEVWEHVIFDGREHIPLITIPGMRERTIKVGSAGKIFSLTGWKIGFVCAAPPLLRVAAKVHQFLTFTTAPNLQAAVAYGLGKPADYFHRDAQGSGAQPRPSHQRAWRASASRCCGRRAPISSPSTFRRSGSTRPTRHSASAS